MNLIFFFFVFEEYVMIKKKERKINGFQKQDRFKFLKSRIYKKNRKKVDDWTRFRKEINWRKSGEGLPRNINLWKNINWICTLVLE